MNNRQPNRLKHYDYSQNGAYFITICTKDRQKIFWGKLNNPNPVGADIIRPQEILNKYGQIVELGIKQIPAHYQNIFIDRYVIMPNHIHILMRINNDDFVKGRIISAPTISIVIGQMKRWISKQIGKPIWQKSFHDHIIRDQRDYDRIYRYIEENPLKWNEDCYYTD